MGGEYLRRQHRQESEGGVDTVDVPITESEVSAKDTRDMLDGIDEILEETAGEKAKLDYLLDEIELVLEPNAQEFVASYQQRGGE